MPAQMHTYMHLLMKSHTFGAHQCLHMNTHTHSKTNPSFRSGASMTKHTCKMEPPATPPCKSFTSDPGLLTSKDLITIICGGDVKSRTGIGILLTMYSHTASQTPCTDRDQSSAVMNEMHLNAGLKKARTSRQSAKHRGAHQADKVPVQQQKCNTWRRMQMIQGPRACISITSASETGSVCMLQTKAYLHRRCTSVVQRSAPQVHRPPLCPG